MCFPVACLPLPLCHKLYEDKDFVLFKNVSSVARIMPDPGRHLITVCLLTIMGVGGGMCAFYKVIRIESFHKGL